MSEKILATAIGAICGQQSGLFKLVLPRSLPASFKKEVTSSVNASGGVAVPVGTGDDEYTAGEAISFRTPDDGDFDRAIVLVATEGDAGELKSLETFRDVLSGGMPGGLDTAALAVLSIDTLTLELAKRASKNAQASQELTKLDAALKNIFRYLAGAYREAGNDEKRWTDAFWQHLDMMADRLSFALSNLPHGAPSYSRDAVYAAAGLPRPDGLDCYAGKNGSQTYAKIVSKHWTSQEEIERSLVEVDHIDSKGEGRHPLGEIDWKSFASSRVSLGHPLLAVAYHGAQGHDRSVWLHGWASTSEKAFFQERVSDAPGYELLSFDVDEKSRPLRALEWQGLDHILPPGPEKLRDDGRICLGVFCLQLDVDVDGDQEDFPVDFDIKPASACSVEKIAWTPGEGSCTIAFELSRSAGKNGGKWREKPFTLSVSPARIGPGSRFFNTLSLKICAPHPSRPTAIAVEDRRTGGKPFATFAADGGYTIDPENGTIARQEDVDELALLKLRDGLVSSRLVVVGESIKPTWLQGASLKQLEQEDEESFLREFALTPLPDNSVIDLNGYQVDVQVPEIEKGQVNPVFAAILGEPVVPVDDELRTELLADPRGRLEEWYQDVCVSASPSADFRSCFGSCVLEAGGRGQASLAWNADIGAFANTSSPIHLKFPAELSESPEAKAFWTAFEALELGRFGGAQEVSAWPGALDLRDMPGHLIEAYLAAFSALLDVVGEPRVHSWLAYPFSAILYNQQRGETEGVLISPLHPIRLAWTWSVQQSCDGIARSQVFGKLGSSFLRFVDGELLPLSGPAPRGSERWVCTGLAPGPREFFAGWTLLAGAPLRENHKGKYINLLNLELPFGTPSGLDQGGVSAALRDYMRIYPASPQLRIGLAAPSGGERYAETDEAIIAASGELLARHGDSLPGGVRIFDSSDRRGTLPSAVSILQKILPEALQSGAPADHAPFEWTTDPEQGPPSSVDLQFIEDTVVRVGVEETNDDMEYTGTCGPSIPFNRYRTWRLDEMASDVSSFSLGLQGGSYGDLPSFAAALEKVERMKCSGSGIKLTSELRLGDDLLGEHARWTITGNRHLDPSVLSSQLRRAPGDIALWEWRPAFLSREMQRGFASSIASTHPYTVLARPSSALTEEVASVLAKCGMSSLSEDTREVISSLGMRGVGLSSLLTMGHTQSLGAIGFSLAFKSLDRWESQAGQDEIRCVLPMDAVYPLFDVLGEGAKMTDDQRRADLLLVAARLDEAGHCVLSLHPVEVKMRSGEGGSFPGRGATQVADPIEQLASTFRVLEQVRKNFEACGSKLALVNGALATLLEAALSLRSARQDGKMAVEICLLGAVAAGKLRLNTSAGTLLWFQVNATGAGGGAYERRPANTGEPGQFFANPACFDTPSTLAEVGEVVSEIVVLGMSGTSLQLPIGLPPVVKPKPSPSPSDKQQSDNDKGQSRSNKVADGTKDPNVKGDQEPIPEGQEDLDIDEQETTFPEGVEVIVGKRPVGASTEDVLLKPSETALNQLNIGVVGDLGTGKTQFLKSLVYQLSNSARSNRGEAPKVFIFDYKRDYSEGDFPEALGARILDPSKRPLPINFFAIGVDSDDRMATQLERVRRANFFCDLLRRISSIGQVQRNDLYTSIMGAYQACAVGHAPSINDVFDVYSALGKNDSVVSVLTLLRDLMIFEPDPENTTTFSELFDRSTVLNLSGLSGAGQDIVDIVATMFLDNLYTDYMKTLPKEPFIDGPDGINRRKIDSFVLIDEAHHAMGRDFDVLMKLMLEGREFGMGVILSSQFLSHFDAGKHDWSEALSTWVVHNVRNATAKQFERIGFRHEVPRMVQEVTSLETHWAYYRCVNGYNEGALMKGQPFYSLPR